MASSCPSVPRKTLFIMVPQNSTNPGLSPVMMLLVISLFRHLLYVVLSASLLPILLPKQLHLRGKVVFKW